MRFLRESWNRRFFCLFVFFLIVMHGVLLAAFAYPDNLVFAVKNDSATLGLFENPDDLRSFGTEVSFSYLLGWFGTARISGLTNRYAQPDEGGRYDELEFFSGYSFRLFRFLLPSRFSLFLEPAFGGVVSGDMGLDFVQNTWHSLIDVPSLELLYDDCGEFFIYPRFSLTGSLVFAEKAPWFDSTDLLMRLRFSSVLSAGYEVSSLALFEMGQRSNDSNYMVVGFGYAQREAVDGRATHVAVSDSESGWIASFEARFGVILLNYRWFPHGSRSYGGLGVDIGTSSFKQWDGSDLVLYLGPRFPTEVYATGLRYRIFPSLSLFAANAYRARVLLESRQVRENLSTWYVGLDYEFDQLSWGAMLPFSSLGFGLKRFLVMGLDDDSFSSRSILYSRIRFSSEFLMGVRFFQRGEFQWDGISYGLELATGVMFLDTDGLEQSVGGVAMTVVKRWQPIIKIGITAGGGL
jgi:hypothetical protein